MVQKIVHIADVHIKNYQRLNEFSEAVDTLVDMLDKTFEGIEYNDRLIVIAGDTVHQKNTVSNELYVFVAKFFRRLEEKAPVLVISGNHDLIVGNDSRVDTLTGIFETACFDNTRFIDMELGYKSGIYHYKNIEFYLYSIWQDYVEPDPTNIKEVNPEAVTHRIGLFHGPIVGSKLSNGSLIDSGLSLDAFNAVPIVMAGDIHKRQTLSYNNGNGVFVYPGSLIQQNLGESVNGHGFATWDLFKDGTYTLKNDIELPTSYAMYKMKIDSIDDIDNDNIKVLNLN